jgi:hypothetical protein
MIPIQTQFVGLAYTGQCYWYLDQSHPERDQLQNCLDSALTELENWVKANKHSEPNQMRYYNKISWCAN